MKKFINTFYFNTAQYDLKDKWGNRISLEVDYKNNRYTAKKKEVKNGNYKKMEEEAGIIAKDLLKRKSGKNLA
jgi:hypothetical protein